MDQHVENMSGHGWIVTTPSTIVRTRFLKEKIHQTQYLSLLFDFSKFSVIVLGSKALREENLGLKSLEYSKSRVVGYNLYTLAFNYLFF